MKETIERPSNNDDKKREVLFTRHSVAKYGTYVKTANSENPQAVHDPNNQLENDLTEAGIELAKEKAEKLFDAMDSKTDALFFASSKEMRAFETAKIYKEIAEKKGFEVIIPHSEKNKDAKVGMARKMADDNIRAIEGISLKIKNTLTGTVFNPTDYLNVPEMNTVDEETKAKWNEARKIIEADDQGTWGANFFKHSEVIQKIFPEIQSSRNEHEHSFKKLLKLTEFAQKKIEASGHDKNIKIMAFGHENYMGHALNEYFGEHELGNCETISIDVDNSENFKLERKN